MICQKIQQELALAAANQLEPGRRAEILAHCQTCRTCAERWRQYQVVSSSQLSAAKELENLSLHFKPGGAPVVARGARPSDVRPSLIWRYLVPVAAVVVLFLLLVLFRQRPVETPSIGTSTPRTPKRQTIDSLPTVATYRRALGEAGEGSLEALLARHESHLLPQTPEVAPTVRLAAAPE